LKNKDFNLLFLFVFKIFLYLHFKRKKEGVKISKPEYAVFVHYQVEQTYEKIKTIGQREDMSCLISFGLSHVHVFYDIE
jgi:hypothetical protein